MRRKQKLDWNGTEGLAEGLAGKQAGPEQRDETRLPIPRLLILPPPPQPSHHHPQTLGGAQNCVETSMRQPILVHGQPLHLNYSTSQEIKRDRPVIEPTVPPNRILLVTITNPLHPITCEILETVCRPHGKVLRIVLVRKNGLQVGIFFFLFVVINYCSPPCWN